MQDPTDLPGPRERFELRHDKRWPIGVSQATVTGGEAVFGGLFDERDVVIAQRAFPGHRVTLGQDALIVGPVPDADLTSEKWTDEDGVRWSRIGRMRWFQRPGESFSTYDSPTPEERRENREQVAADRAEEWGATVAEYESTAGSVEVAWRYLIRHPIFHRWELPRDLADLDAEEVDEATWARIEAEGHLLDWRGLDHADTTVWLDNDGLHVSIEHGPTLWPLDVPAAHRYGMSVRGVPSHDYRIDATAASWEEAIIALAANVRREYGDDRSRVPQ